MYDGSSSLSSKKMKMVAHYHLNQIPWALWHGNSGGLCGTALSVSDPLGSVALESGGGTFCISQRSPSHAAGHLFQRFSLGAVGANLFHIFWQWLLLLHAETNKHPSISFNNFLLCSKDKVRNCTKMTWCMMFWPTFFFLTLATSSERLRVLVRSHIALTKRYYC